MEIVQVVRAARGSIAVVTVLAGRAARGSIAVVMVLAGRAARGSIAVVMVLVALAGCGGTPGRGGSPTDPGGPPGTGTSSGAPGQSSASGGPSPDGTGGPSDHAVGSITPVPMPGTAPAALPADPARCAQPALSMDDLRAAPSASPWRVVSRGEGHGRLDDLAVGGDGAVWATHSTQRRETGGVVETFEGLRRWDGARWESFPLPRAAVTAVGAVSGELAWAFGQSGQVGTFSDGRLVPGRFAGRDGSGIGLYGTAARGPWVVSGRTALRWDGSAWQAYRLPVGASAVGGEGANVWTVSAAVSPAQPAAHRSSARPQPAARWNGSAWQAVGVPELGLPRKVSSPRAHLDDVAVLGTDDVWAVGGVSWLAPGKTDAQGEPLEILRPVALHWDGGGWRCLWGASGRTFTQAEPDGRGGVWVLDSTGSRLLHHAGGRWTSTEIAGTVTTLSHRPGSDEVYAAGSTPNTTDLTQVTLWRNH
ncbi:hypothetical protein [Nonomuraea rosea]|uniref:hypothetical protein n=1 Tax=Nonomuraea rosea TaxID=638574 RepID=UPI0031EBE981